MKIHYNCVTFYKCKCVKFIFLTNISLFLYFSSVISVFLLCHVYYVLSVQIIKLSVQSIFLITWIFLAELRTKKVMAGPVTSVPEIILMTNRTTSNIIFYFVFFKKTMGPLPSLDIEYLCMIVQGLIHLQLVIKYMLSMICIKSYMKNNQKKNCLIIDLFYITKSYFLHRRI